MLDCSILRDPDSGKVVNVYAPNGEPSILYQDALVAFDQNADQAILAWAAAYTPEFMGYYGDWINEPSKVSLDANGEPISSMVFLSVYDVLRDPRYKSIARKKGYIPFREAVRIKNSLEQTIPGSRYKLDESGAEPGYAKVTALSSIISYAPNYTKEEIQRQKEKITPIMEYMIRKFPGVSYQWISPNQLKQSEHYTDVRRINSFVKDNVIYLVEGRVTPQIALEEISHVFVEFLRQDRPALFKGLFESLKNDPKYTAEYVAINEGLKAEEKLSMKDIKIVAQSEFLARNLATALKAELEMNPEGRPLSPLGKLFKRFFEWLANTLGMPRIDPKMTLQDIAAHLNSKYTEMELPTEPYLYYNADPNANFDPEDRDAAEELNPIGETQRKKKTAQELNLQRAKENVEKLNKMKAFVLRTKPNNKQRENQIAVIDILIDNANYQVTELEAGRATVSITKYKGSEDTESLDNKTAEMGANFGTFFHTLIEDLQDSYMENGINPTKLYTQEWFDAFYEKHKKMIQFKDVDKQLLFDAGLEISQALSSEFLRGKILLPEISVAVEDAQGTLILGRLDLMALDELGRVSVMDLKTSKSAHSLVNLNGGPMFPMIDLSVSYTNKNGWKDGVSEFFADILNRTKMNTYHMQLALYGEMLKKLGIVVSSRNVLALAYRVQGKEADQQTVVQTAFHVFDDSSFYTFAFNGQKASDEGRIIDTAARLAFNGREEEIDEDAAAETDPGPFARMSKDVQEDLINRLIKLATDQLTTIEKERSEIEKNDLIDKDEKNNLIKILTKRKAGLVDMSEKLKLAISNPASSESLAASRAVIIKAALDVFSNEISTISRKINEDIDIPATYKLGSDENRTAIATLQSYLTSLDNMADYLQGFKNTILATTLDPDSQKDETLKKDLIRYFDDKLFTIDAQNQKMVNIGKSITKAIIMETIGTKNFEKVFGEVKKVLAPRLAWLDRTIEKIKKGEAPADTMGLKARRVLASIFKQVQNPKERLQLLEEERNKIARMMDINQLTDATLDTYLDGILNDDNSSFSMGQTMGNVLGISMSDIIGSNADSEMIVSAMFQYMRNMTEDARIEALRWADSLGIDELKRAAIESLGGLQQANKILTQEVEVVTEFDENGEPELKETYRQYVDPVLEDFYKTHDKYRSNLRKYSKLIREKSVEKRNEVDPVKAAILDQQLKELIKEEEALSLEWTQWRIDNTETRIKPEVLMLMHGSGFTNSQITENYSQINAIINAAGGEENLSEDQQEQIDYLEAEISRIRTETIKDNPEAQERIDALLEYFEFDYNYTLWAKKRVAIEASGDKKALERWDYNNTNEVPTEDWNQAREKLYEDMMDILGKDEVLGNLYRERSLIKAKAKIRGKFNFNYLNQEDIDRYHALDEQISNRLAYLRETSPLTEDEAADLTIVTQRLANIETKVLDPRYIRQRDQLKDTVRKAYAALNEAKKKFTEAPESIGLRDQLDAAQSHYEKTEREFADFFNKNNQSKYTLGENIIAERKALKELPNSYLFVKQPKNPAEMERFPNKKYRIKRLKSESYNPKYQNSFVEDRMGGGMYPMPKGIRFNETINEFEISPSAKFVNPNFMTVQNNPIAKDFYKKWIIEQYLIKQKNASGKRLGFNLPYVQQLALENVMAKGMDGMAREYQEKLQEISYQNSELEKATNESGIAGQQRVLFKENHLVPAALTTTDGIGAIVNWNAGYYTNRKMAMISNEMSAVLTFLKDIQRQIQDQSAGLQDANKESHAQRLEAINSIITQIEYNKDKFIFGKLFEKGDSENSVFNRKTMRLFMGVASFARMAFDVPMQFGNMLSGNVQAFLSTSNHRHASTQNYLNAKKMIYTRWFPKMIADWGTVSDASFETKLFRYMNPLSKDLDRLFDANTVSKMRRLGNRIFNITDLSMALQDKGEIEIGLTTMLMIMDGRRYEVFDTDSQGNLLMDDQGNRVVKKNPDGSIVYVNAIDAFGIDENNSIAPKKNVNISQQEINSLKSLIMGEIYRHQGNYANYTKSKFGSTMLGSLYEFYRKYLIPAVSVRFHLGKREGVGSMYSWDTQEAYMGWYMALGRMYQYYGLGKATKTLLYDTLLPGLVKKKINADTGIEQHDFYRGRAAMAGREILIAIAFYMLYQTLRSALYDGDEEDFTYAELSMMRALVKVSNESRSMVPLFVVGKPGDYIDNFGSFTSAFREGKTIWELGNNAFFWANYHTTGSMFAYERGFYQRDTARFEEGDAKVLKNLYDLTGWSNVVDTFEPYEAAKANLKMK